MGKAATPIGRHRLLILCGALVVGLSLSPSVEAGHILCNGENLTYHQPTPNGPDNLSGTDNRDVFHGEGGDDSLIGNGGPDILCGGADQDIISGVNGQDYISGGDSQDLLHGNDLDDEVRGFEGFDDVHGDNGKDDITGNAANDDMFDGNEVDRVDGGPDGPTGGDQWGRCEDGLEDHWVDIEERLGPAEIYC